MASLRRIYANRGRARCTPKRRCKVGLILSQGERESFDVWFEVRTGLVKLIRQTDA
jgi:hypothetical protein